MLIISLMKPIGIIRHASHSLESVFGYKDSFSINKNVNFLMVNYIAKEHDKMLNHYISTGASKY